MINNNKKNILDLSNLVFNPKYLDDKQLPRYADYLEKYLDKIISKHDLSFKK